ncbi:MAG: hypothetical protein A2Y17_05665 [Clostridiales bacterium GWF2_38_85]|nr:MAG: hypothetical protein A2Y17_05665 [Clostridiales bacterium GWF2_38_85]HBL84031.1 hypothetical protein [Clostridiales bacterium]
MIYKSDTEISPALKVLKTSFSSMAFLTGIILLLGSVIMNLILSFIFGLTLIKAIIDSITVVLFFIFYIECKKNNTEKFNKYSLINYQIITIINIGIVLVASIIIFIYFIIFSINLYDFLFDHVNSGDK